MASSGNNYRLLIEGRLDPTKINADIRALEKKGSILLNVSIDEKSKRDLFSVLNELQAKGNTIGKIVFSEGATGEINKIAVNYVNQLGQAEKTWVKINEGVEITKVRTVDLANVDKEILKIEQSRVALLAKQADEMDRAALGAEKFLAKSKSMNQSASVMAATGTAKEILSAVSDKDINKVRELNRQFQIQKAALDSSKTTLQSWSEGLKRSMIHTIEYATSVGLLYGALNKLSKGIQYITDLNKELVSIQVIQAEGAKTPEDIASLAIEYNDLAKELGATTIEISKGSLEWLRQGKTIAETKELLRSTVMLAKLGNLDTAQSTEYLTSIVNGFNKEASESNDIVSKLIALDNMAATSAGEIATAMQYSSAVANDTGVSFENLAAMITTVSSSTRLSAEMIGTAFRSMFVRMEQVKSGEIDETGISLNNVEKSLSNVNIRLRDSANSFRPLEDVIADVAEKWETLDEVTRAQISNAIAGQRQAQIFSSLMSNWGDMAGYVAAETDSAGLAQERYSIYLDGVEAAQNRVTAETERFWQEAISSGNVSRFYQFVAGIIELVNNLGGLKTILATATIALIYFNSAQIATVATNLYYTIANMIVGFYGYATSVGVATAAMELFNSTNPIGWITLLIGAIALVAINLDTMEEKLEKVNASIEEHNQKISELKDTATRIDELSKSYSELSSKTNLSKEESEKLLAVSTELKQLVPELSGYFDEYGNYILDAGQSMDNLSGATKEQIRLEQELKQAQLDESAAIQAKMLLEKENDRWQAEQAAKRRENRGIAPISKTEEIEVNLDWTKALDSSKLAFEQMSEEGKLAFIKALRDSGDAGARLAEDIFVPLMNKVKEVKDNLKENPIEVPLEPVVSDDAKKAFDEIIDMTMDMIKQRKEAEKDAIQDELDNLKEVADAQKEYYEAEYEAIKKNADAAKKKLDEEYENQKRIFDDRRRALEDELDSYKKIIDAERDRLKAQKDRHEYELSLQENTEDLANLEEQIAELALDNSAEGIAKRKELEAQAAELRKKMAEEQSDYEYELQMQALETEEQKAEEENNLLVSRLEEEERAYQYQYELQLKEIENAEQVAKEKYEIVISSIDAEYEANKAALEEKITQIEEYLSQEGTIRRDALEMMKKDNESLYQSLLEWNKKYGTGLDEDIISIWEKAIDAVREYRQEVISLPPPPSSSGQPIITSTLGETGPLEEIIYGTTYHDGAEKGAVGNSLGLKSNEYFAKLMAGEVVVNSDQINRFLSQTLPSMLGVPRTSSAGGGSITVDMPINVAGSLDKAVVPDLEKMVDRVVKKLNDNLLSRGMMRRADSFSI